MAAQISSLLSEAKVDMRIKKIEMNFQRAVRPGSAMAHGNFIATLMPANSNFISPATHANTYDYFAAGPRPADFINFRNGLDVRSVNYQDRSSMRFQQSSFINFQESSFVNPQTQVFINFHKSSIKSRKTPAIKSRYPAGFKCEEIKKLQQLGDSTRFTTWICIDLEATNDRTTEVGITWFQPLKDTYPRSRHFIIHGNEEYHLGQIKPKKKLPFKFGVSEVKTRDEAAMRIMDLVSRFQLMGDVVLVGFALLNDLKWLAAMDVDLNELKSIDLQKVDAELRGVTIYNARRLGAVCAELRISAASPHNAGNDAMYTWQAAMGILGRIQRDGDMMSMLGGPKAS